MQHWEYKIVMPYWINGFLFARFVDDQELKNWKKIPLRTFLLELGAEGWEMAGTISISESHMQCMFFKRPLPS